MNHRVFQQNASNALTSILFYNLFNTIDIDFDSYKKN